MTRFAISVCLLLFAQQLFAQNDTLFQRADIPVVQDIDTLIYGFAGGLNNPQFSEIDLDGDGKKDLVVFDRADNRLLTFQNTGESGARPYRYAPQFERFFPTDSLSDWVLLADYNCDGFKDIFTNHNSNIRVFRNTAPQTGKLGFEWISSGLNVLLFPQTTSAFETLLYNAGGDVPGIVDADYDGDLDILAYDVNGIAIQYFENRAKEDFNRCDTLVFWASSECWGHFSEVYDFGTGQYTAEIGNNFCPGELKTDHVGGAILPLDLNGDDLMDVVVSDNGPAYMLGLSNGGNHAIANMINLDDLFPINDTRVFIESFPAGFHVDANQDGKRDLLVAPNLKDASRDVNNVWYYENEGDDNAPVFKLKERNYLQSEMLDIGTGASPWVFDYNNDGLPDLLTGMESKYLTETTKYAGLALYLNTGTAEKPVYLLEKPNFLYLGGNALTANLRGLAPTTGDLDADGKPEIVMGMSSGKLWLFKDLAPAGSDTAQYTLFDSNFLNLPPNIIKYTTPLLVDIDKDNDLDLVVGNQRGTLWLFENSGTSAAATFTPVTDVWGKVRVRSDFSPNGYSRPAVANVDKDAEPELVVGNADGYLLVFDGALTTSATDSFPPLGALGKRDFGVRVKPAILPLNDTTLRVFVGVQRGGIEVFDYGFNRKIHTDTTDTTVVSRRLRPDVCRLYPNPTDGRLEVEAPLHTSLEVFNSWGQCLQTLPPADQTRRSLDLSALPNGLYYLRFRQSSAFFSRSFVVDR